MLTRNQIQRLAQRHRIGMQVQERDYVQHLLLFLLYSRTQAFVFKGGTALRLAYRGNRYSEDLDFNGPQNTEDLQAVWSDIIAGLQDFGLAGEVRNEWISDVGYSLDVSYQGPLFDGRDRSKGKVRIDINRRPEPVTSRRELINSDYDDVRAFVVTVITPDQMLAEKMRALLVRGKPRDLYDIWLLTNQGVPLDKSLIDLKLSLYGMTFTKAALQSAMAQLSGEWERDLRPLLPQFVTHEEVLKRIQGLLDGLSA